MNLNKTLWAPPPSRLTSRLHGTSSDEWRLLVYPDVAQKRTTRSNSISYYRTKELSRTQSTIFGDEKNRQGNQEVTSDTVLLESQRNHRRAVQADPFHVTTRTDNASRYLDFRSE